MGDIVKVAVTRLPAPAEPAHTHTGATGPRETALQASWCARYGHRHRMQRVANWPPGVAAPKKVRVYLRNSHWLLQWWEPGARKNVSERVEGDAVDAVTRAREVDRRLGEFKTSGRLSAGGRVGHRHLVEAFVSDLRARCEAGELEPRSVARYASALRRHYLAYADQPERNRTCRRPSGANRDFALGFAAFLASREVSPNGSANAAAQKMKGTGFVWGAVRALFAWAADPDRGNLLPEGFRNPFLRSAGGRKPAPDLFGEPDVTVAMAVQLLEACDDYQLRLFAPVALYGLRAAEPAFLFDEYIDGQWLRVPCNPELFYTTKGKRDKRLPLFEPLASLLGSPKPGLLFVRRAVHERREAPPLLGNSLAELTSVVRRRLKESGPLDAARRQKLRDGVLADAGATTYDRIQDEFNALSRRLAWPAAATLKDLRHLFATAMAAAGMAEPYRQYLMGHATTTAAIGVYTHLNRIKEQYLEAVGKELEPLVEVLRRRLPSSNGRNSDGASRRANDDI